MSIFVIKTKEGDYLDKAGAKVKSIFDAKLFKKEDLELTLLDASRRLSVQPILFSEELKSINR